MKAISLKQPWATLMALGVKRFETRGKHLNIRVGDLVAIHASKTWGPDQRAFCEAEPCRTVLAQHGITLNSATHYDLPRGTVVAVAECRSVLPTTEAKFALQQIGTMGGLEIAFGDYSEGRTAFCLMPMWTVGDPFIHARGQLGVWQLPAGVEHRVLVALQHHAALPDQLTSPALLDEAIRTAEAREAKAEQVEWMLARLKGGADTRTPIERMIDKAVGR